MSVTSTGLARGVTAAVCAGFLCGAARAMAQVAGEGSWLPTGTLNVARSHHTATLLSNGQVLVTGGYGPPSSPGVLAARDSAEIYDPASGAWRYAASMKGPRADHKAVGLADGGVLVIGGNAGPGTSAEVYDPSRDEWIAVDDLLVTRSQFAAVRLADGRVLVTGGFVSNGPYDVSNLGNAEIFDPKLRTWRAVASMNGRTSPSAAVLADGRVLVAGGDYIVDFNYDTPLPTVDLFDPVHESWAAGPPLNLPRDGGAAVPMPDGGALVLGGDFDSSATTGGSLAYYAERYDPRANAWRAAAGESRGYDLTDVDTATALGSGEVLALGSPASNRQPSTFTRAQIYNPVADVWRDAATPGPYRQGATATRLPDGRVLLAGGWDPGTSPKPLADAEVFVPAVPISIDAGFTGAWYDPAQSGHGLFVEVLPGNQMLVAWFAFAPNGGQAWFYGVGTYEGNTATVSAMDQPSGGRWIPNFDPAAITHNAWGSLTLTLTDCNHGRVDFASTLGYGSGSMYLTRLTQPSALQCP